MKPTSGQWNQPELSATVFRGVGSVNPSSVGSHYSADRGVAQFFRGNRGGALITAEVPISSMETNTDILTRKGVLKGPNQSSETDPVNEKEVTVRTGAPVKVKSIETLGPKVNTKSIKNARENYNPNRTIDYYTDEENAAHSKMGARFHRTRTRTFSPPRDMPA